MAMPDTRQLLLDAAQELVQRVGANAMSYQDLSDAVGIRKASIHYHFPTKSDLLIAVIERYTDSLLAKVDEILQSERTASAKLQAYFELFEATLRVDSGRRACPGGMLGAELETLGPEVGECVKRFNSENCHRVSRILELGLRDGSFEFKGNPSDLAWLVFSALEGGMQVARVDGGVKLFRTMAEQLRRLLEP